MSQPLTLADVDTIKARIEHAISRMDDVEVLKPSAFWAFCLEHMAYVRHLPAGDLDQIRQHSFHITGDLYQYYLFTPPADVDARLRKMFDPSTIAPDLLIDEPDGGIGHRVDGRFLSVDSQRYQNVVSELDRAGMLAAKPRRVLEIGSGYGGLARAVSQVLPGVQYCMVDLPQTMFFAAVYLSRFVGPAAVTIATEPKDLEAKTPFLLVPVHLAPALSDLRFDLAINQSSMQEMTPAQIDYYLALINRTTPRFYSRNKVHRSHLLAGTSEADANDRIQAQMAEILWQLPAPPASSSIKGRVQHLRNRVKRAIRGVTPGPTEQPLLYRTRFSAS